jgi:phosphonate degradation associated HDIG domain protein
MEEPIVTRIAELFAEKGARRYGLHDVTQCQHALQAAWLAEQDGCAPSLIAAALLHDIGHMTHDLGENPAERGVDDRHEEVGHAFLARWFGPEVTEPVRLHVAAKRYLCAIEPDYRSRLSPDSVSSLKLQGGPMNEPEADAFSALPHGQEAVKLRRFDEAAKVRDRATPSVEHFLPYLAALRRRR